MNFFYDLHLHSCLSPCGDQDMTPYNLVHMAQLLGYDLIALTDHNTTRNCRAALEVGKASGMTVIPGMELCTAEEIHMICLFEALESAEQFGAFVRERIPPVSNRPEVFGAQLLMDAEDRVLGEEELLLVTASSISIEDLPDLMPAYGGICYPAHIDRASYSIISSLGVFPEHLCFSAAEISPLGNRQKLIEQHPVLNQLRLITSSDAHHLEHMPDPTHQIALDELSAACLIRTLRQTV
ncbi:MAG TPA: PHP domain-containing protein [Firmicutes bacterium]|nr:PHP domain-containing protein [Bacillota bacterium]